MPENSNKKDDRWAMPEPVFQSSEGRDLSADDTPESEIPTEPADRDFTTEQGFTSGSQGVRPKANRHTRHKNKRKKSYWERNAAGLIVLAVLLIGALIYLAWLYKGKLFA